MKIPLLKSRKNEQGSVLAIGLVIATVLGFTLASYLMLTTRQHRSVFRSQTWGTSLALSEAGVEEALAFINQFAMTSTELSTWTNYYSGWAQSGNVYRMERTVDAALGSYTVYVTNRIINAPEIYAEGNALWRLTGGFVPQPYYAYAGAQGATLEPTTVARRVFVPTQKAAIFGGAMAAIGQINLKGNNVATDSFNSSPTSTNNINGQYPESDLSRTGDKGNVYTLSTLVDSLNVGNADIKGYVKTGESGTVAIGPSGSVGDKAWVDGGNNGIQTGHSADDFNVDFPKVEEPGFTWSALPTATNTTINGITYDRVITSGNYQVSGDAIKGKVYIANDAKVVLRVTSSVSMSGSDRVDISATNASLKIYMAGADFTVAGTANINNLSKNALNSALYGLPTCTSITLGGNAAFSGTVYAPQADFTLGGGGSTVYDFVGASVTKTVTMNGHFKFHYDEYLLEKGPSLGYVPTSWAERKAP